MVRFTERQSKPQESKCRGEGQAGEKQAAGQKQKSNRNGGTNQKERGRNSSEKQKSQKTCNGETKLKAEMWLQRNRKAQMLPFVSGLYKLFLALELYQISDYIWVKNYT